MAEKVTRINEQIRVREIRLIDENGDQRGVIPTIQAIGMAKDLGLDLVEIAPQSIPPVCKILNYGKFKFEQEKKARESRKKVKIGELKEIRMQPNLQEHDLDFKSAHVKRFLSQGFKVKVTIRFKGRQMAHTDIGANVLKDVLSRLDGAYLLERQPLMEGRFMSMVLQPKVVPGKKPAEPAAKPDQVPTNSDQVAKA